MAGDGSDNLGKNINREQFGLSEPEHYGMLSAQSLTQRPGLNEKIVKEALPQFHSWPTATISLDRVHASQDYVIPDKVNNFAAHPRLGGLPKVVKHDGEHFVFDGHHRVAGAMVRGQKTMKVNLFNADS